MLLDEVSNIAMMMMMMMMMMMIVTMIIMMISRADLTNVIDVKKVN